MRRRTLVPAALAALLIAPTLLAAPAHAVDSESEDAAARAVSWLVSQQEADGGFELADFAGFETPDAVLAIAEGAQHGDTWSESDALAAVEAVQRDGVTPLDYLDDFAEAGLTPGQAAKLIVLVAAPLGLDSESFDPQDDGPTDLVSIVVAGGAAEGFYGDRAAFNDTLYAAIGLSLAGVAIPPRTLEYIVGAQQANGGWAYNADPSGATEADVDTTGLAAVALVAAGVVESPALDGAQRFLAGADGGDLNGGFIAFGSPDPNATARAIQGIEAMGWSSDSSCWHAAVDPDGAIFPYATPRSYLRAVQAEDGRIQSPNDSFGVNTIATSQSVAALLARWLPVRLPAQQCVPYRLHTAGGNVAAFGGASWNGFPGVPSHAPAIAAIGHPGGNGYWQIGPDGAVSGYGAAVAHGDMVGTPLIRPVIGGSSTASGNGYWLFAEDGGIFAFGDAGFFGSTGGIPLNQPIVAMTPTPSGNGYWMFAADGGVFAFGDAAFHGSMGGTPLNQPVVSGLGSNNGYWMVAADGGVFAFGDAPFVGSALGTAVAGQTIGMAAPASRNGYWLAGRDGAVVGFGMPVRGDLLGHTGTPVVAITS